MGRVVGIDFGTVRFGIAISDETKMLARVLTTLIAEKKSEATIAKLLKELEPYTIDEIIIGYPLHMNGKLGFLADEVNHFVALLKTRVTIPITIWDERLTTVQAERSLREASLSRKKRSKIIDSITAVILLQSYLDHLSFKKGNSHVW
ncbi:MAG: Holliday junction resolvase RuvX [Chlamydiales bacterium]|nr:Holliday junction resolvase RuvX [Chlamydiales bacterium]